VEVYDGSSRLAANSDYKLAYLNNTNATSDSSKAIVTIIGTGNYAGVFSEPFEIKPRTWTPGEVANMVQGGSAITITAAASWRGSGTVDADIAIYDSSRRADGSSKQALQPQSLQPQAAGDYRLVAGTDFQAAYSGNGDVGEATVTLKGIGNYSFDLTQAYTIKGDLAAAKVEPIATQPWTGKAITPSPEVSLGNRVLAQDTDYSVAYHANSDAGTATLSITGLGLYEGTTATSFLIERPVQPGDGGGEGNGNGGNTGGGNGGSGGSSGSSSNATSGSTGSSGTAGTTTNNYYGSSGSAGNAAGSAAAATPVEGASTNDTATATTTSQRGRAESPSTTGTSNTSIPEVDEVPLADAGAGSAAVTDITLVTILAIVGTLVLALLVGIVARLYLRNRRLESELSLRA
jgi:hypothetical protein